jgi:hypothetical protein
LSQTKDSLKPASVIFLAMVSRIDGASYRGLGSLHGGDCGEVSEIYGIIYGIRRHRQAEAVAAGKFD